MQYSSCVDCKYYDGENCEHPFECEFADLWYPNDKTNFDVITKSLDALAKFVFDNVDCSTCQIHGPGCSVDCQEYIKNWLAQPEEENNG